MSDTKRGLFRRKREEAPVEQRSVLEPTFVTSPPTWADFNASYQGSVSVQQALAIPAVAASVRSIVTAVSQLDMTVERTIQGVTTPLDSPVVAQPDKNRSRASFFKRTATNLVIHGNAYWWIKRLSDGSVQEIECLPVGKVQVQYEKGVKSYLYTDAAGVQRRLTNNTPTVNGQVEHIKLGEFEEWDLGVGPLQLNNAALYSIAELRFYTDRFLAESRRPSGIYSFEGDIDPEELAQAKSQIMNNRTTGEPDVLPGGVKYQTVMITPESAQLAEMNKQAVLEVARMFGVPPYKLSAAIDGNSMTYANVSQADMAWVRESLEQYLTAIEDAMTNVLPRGQVAKFDIDNWLRAAEAIQVKDPTEGSASAPVSN